MEAAFGPIDDQDTKNKIHSMRSAIQLKFEGLKAIKSFRNDKQNYEMLLDLEKKFK